MTTNVYTGNALPVAQVSTVQVTAYDATTTYTLTVGGIDLSVLGTTDVNGTAAALQAAWDASTHPYHSAITATVSTDTVTLTGPSMMPFTVTSSVTTGTGTIGSVTETTAATGPHHWDNADNWSTAVPVNSDDVYIDKPDCRVLWGLDQDSVTLASLTIRNNPIIGLPSDRVSTNGDASTTDQTATEYRQHYLKIRVTTVRIGEHLQPGSLNGVRRVKLDNQIATASTTTIFNTGTSALESDLPAVRLLFGDADADLFVRLAQSGVGVAIDESNETSTMGEVVVSDSTTASSVFIGEGVTLTSYEQSGGDNILSAAATVASLEVNGGKLRTEGGYLFTAATINDGSVEMNNAGAGDVVATTVTQDGGEVDCQQNGIAQVFTTYNLNEGTRKIDDTVSITNDNRSGRITEQVF